MGSPEKLTKIKEFKAIPIRCLYNSENFKIYGCTIDSFKYPNIAVSKYGTVTRKGDIQELNLDCEYIIKADEEKIPSVNRSHGTLSHRGNFAYFFLLFLFFSASGPLPLIARYWFSLSTRA